MELLKLINQQRAVQEQYCFTYVVMYQIELIKNLEVFASKEKDVGW